MSNTIISTIMWIILVVLQSGYGLAVYKLGVQSGRQNTVVKFMEDNGIIKEE